MGYASITFASGIDDDFAPVADMPAVDAFNAVNGPTAGFSLRWSGWSEFIVASDGSRVTHRPVDGCARTVFQNFLFAQVLGVALVRRGLGPLHASVVEVGGGAIGFLGDCTFGKSTLVASFSKRGYRLVTDDCWSHSQRW